MIPTNIRRTWLFVLLGKDFLLYQHVRGQTLFEVVHNACSAGIILFDKSASYKFLFPKHNLVSLLEEEYVLNLHMVGILLFL